MAEDTSTGQRLAKSTRARAIIGVLLVVVVGIVIWYLRASGRETTNDAQVEAHVTQIATRVGGTVLSVKVKEHQLVEAGTVLVEIDPRDYQIALDRARAELADAEAGATAAQAGVPIASATTASDVTSADAGVDQADTAILVARRELEAAQARLTSSQARERETQALRTRAEKDQARLKDLAAKDEIPQQQYDAAVAAADAARAAHDLARSGIVEAETAVKVGESRVAQAEARHRQARASLSAARTAPQQLVATRARAEAAAARVQQARAHVAMAEQNLKYATLVAPTRGVVGRKSVEPGQVLQPGQPVMSLVNLDELWIVANFKETQLEHMRVGQSVEFSVDAIGGRTYKGRIESIAPATGSRFSMLPPENATGNFVKVVQRVPVKIAIDAGQDSNLQLRPGLSVEPTVFLK